MTNIHRMVAGAFLLGAAAGCSGKQPDPTAAQREQPGDSDGAVAVSGIVQKSEVEGGCWVLMADDSTRYELRAGQAPDSILVDQKRVTVNIKHRTDLMSTCQVGQIVDVVP